MILKTSQNNIENEKLNAEICSSYLSREIFDFNAYLMVPPLRFPRLFHVSSDFSYSSLCVPCLAHRITWRAFHFCTCKNLYHWQKQNFQKLFCFENKTIIKFWKVMAQDNKIKCGNELEKKPVGYQNYLFSLFWQFFFYTHYCDNCD